MIHQGFGGAEGSVQDVQIQARHMLDMDREFNEILARHTGKTVAEIEQDIRRDYWMRAEDAVKYGIADKVPGREG